MVSISLLHIVRELCRENSDAGNDDVATWNCLVNKRYYIRFIYTSGECASQRKPDFVRFCCYIAIVYVRDNIMKCKFNILKDAMVCIFSSEFLDQFFCGFVAKHVFAWNTKIQLKMPCLHEVYLFHRNPTE